MWLDRIDPAFGNWFAGFADGEGSFCIRRARMLYKGTQYEVYACQFLLALRRDDAEILAEVQRTLALGKVVPKAASKQAARRNEKPAMRFEVVSKPDAVRLAEFFDRFPLRAKKAGDYAIWRRALVEWQKTGRGRRGHDWEPMRRLKQELEQGRRYQEV